MTTVTIEIRRRSYYIIVFLELAIGPNNLCTHVAFLASTHCPVSNNSIGSFWISIVLVGHGFINFLASESFVVSLSYEIENLILFDVIWN